MPDEKPQETDYSSKNIPTFTPREHIRRRPTMYLGGTDIKGLHHLIWSATYHMLEEAMLGLCSMIRIEISDDNEVLIINDGTLLIDPQLNMESNSKALDTLLADCKTRSPLSDMYFGVQGGLHVMGLGIVNCLSKKFSLSIEHHTDVWMHFYEQGLATDRIIHQALSYSPRTQTTIRFIPDFTIMDENDFEIERIVNRFRDISYLIPNLECDIVDNRVNCEPVHLHSNYGLADWVSVNGSIPVGQVLRGEKISELKDESGKSYNISVQFAFQFTGSEQVSERSFLNTIETPDGGTHIESLHEAIVQYVRDEFQETVTWDDISSGFVGIIHLLHPAPPFEGRTRMKITNTDVKDVVFACFQEMLAENPTALETLHENLVIRG